MTPAIGVDPASHKHASSKLPVNTRMETRLDILRMPMHRRQETLVEEKIEPLKRRSVHRAPQRDIRCANPRGNRHRYRYTINRRGWQHRCMRNVCHGVLEPPTPVGRRTEKPRNNSSEVTTTRVSKVARQHGGVGQVEATTLKRTATPCVELDAIGCDPARRMLHAGQRLE
jgi:hypothetical protein